MSAQLAENLGKVLNTNGEDQNSYESKKTAGQVDMTHSKMLGKVKYGLPAKI